MNMTHRTKLVLVGLAVLALPTLGRAAPNLLIQGSDFGNIVPLVNIVNPLVAGFWGVENAVRDTGPTQGVVPRTFPWMLKMDDDGLVVTQAFQFVDLVAKGLGPGDTLEAEAWYNANVPAADIRLKLHYFRTDADFSSPLSSDGRAMILDDDPSTWQGLFFRSTIPVDATWVGFEVDFFNASIGTDSGFVDSASLAVPEPASMIALGVGLAALAARRRRRK